MHSEALNRVNLGNTGLVLSELGFGGIPIIRLKEAEAERVVRAAYEMGINLFDTANAYKDSERKMGNALRGLRDRVVLATKSFKRDGQGLAADLEHSLRQLQTDYIDIFQLHQVSREEQWQEITRPSGAMEELLRARDQGKVGHIGVSSHSPDMALRLVRSREFATLQFPFNFLETEPRDSLHPEAKEAGMGILAMKPFAGGAIDDAPLAMTFLRQYPDVIPLPGFHSVASLEQIVSLYSRPNRVLESDRRRMREYRQELGQSFCRRCEYCQPCPHGVMISTAMGYPLVASRMSPRTAVEFTSRAMETVPQCQECGECEEKCPYALPIRQRIKENYEFFLTHRENTG